MKVECCSLQTSCNHKSQQSGSNCTSLCSYLQGLHLHRIKCLALLDASKKCATNSFTIHVCMYAFNKIAVGCTRSPNIFRNVGFFPAQAFKRKLASDFVLDPVLDGMI